MPNGPERSEPGGNPLEGVLDHLLARERGVRAGQAGTRVETAPAAGRRMLVLAALGHDAGAGARAALARRAIDLGRRPAALDVACGQPPAAARATGGPAIPLASIPCGPERLLSLTLPFLRYRALEQSTGGLLSAWQIAWPCSALSILRPSVIAWPISIRDCPLFSGEAS